MQAQSKYKDKFTKYRLFMHAHGFIKEELSMTTDNEQIKREQPIGFLKYPSTQKLEELARHPIDLSAPGNLTEPKPAIEFKSSAPAK